VYAGSLDDEPPHPLNEISETAKADVAKGRRKLMKFRLWLFTGTYEPESG
jgi:hypothetical protein